MEAHKASTVLTSTSVPMRSCRICCRPLRAPYSAARVLSAPLTLAFLAPPPRGLSPHCVIYCCVPDHPARRDQAQQHLYYLSRGSGLARLCRVAHPLHVALASTGTAAVARFGGWPLGAQLKLSVGGCIRVPQRDNH